MKVQASDRPKRVKRVSLWDSFVSNPMAHCEKELE